MESHSDSLKHLLQFRKLTSAKFFIWEFQTVYYFEAKECWPIINGSEKEPEEEVAKASWQKRTDITCYNILQSVDEEDVAQLVSSMLAIDMWFHLIMLHEQTTEENVVRVQEKFYSCRMQENETAIAFIMQIVAVQFLFLH
jgi:hypothetical protein